MKRGGYANQLLKSADRLAECPIFYWGDMDSYGFEISAQLRSHFPQTQSIFMDSATYEHFQSFSVSVAVQSAHTLPNLTENERALYTYLATEGQRLEQERISQTYSNQRLQGLA